MGLKIENFTDDEIPGMGRAKRYIITIASDDRGPLDKLCQSLIAVGATCDVLRNSFGQTNVRGARLPAESIARRPTGQDQPEQSAGD
jgi:hypothetical protein